ncbi:MAG: DUF2281 domain-containing protein [Selenomonadales bacterium]|nr:DUF2281 domain-containing protein [Selenomonadales bacterium]
MQSIQELVEKLPPDLQQEVRDFVEFLWERKVYRRQRKLRLTWAGALREHRTQFTSLELQKKALEWWGNDHSCI